MIPLNKLYEYPTSTRALYNGERMYDVGKDKLPSVTTILAATQSQEKQASLAAWRARVGMNEAARITDQAATRGTSMHTILEGYILGQNHVDMTSVGEQAHLMAQQIIDKGLHNRLTEIWGSEVVLYYPELYAGATDIVGMYDGTEAIVDFKQSNKAKRREWIGDYKLQLAAYALAHNEIYGTNIQKGVNLICTKDNLYQEFIFEGEEFRQAKFEWLARVGLYYKNKGATI
jgi:genome maintenance exonuclease 1